MKRVKKKARVQKEKRNLIGKANADSEQNTAEKKHIDIGGRTAQGSTGEKSGAADVNGGLSSEGPGDGGGEEGEKKAGNVKGRSEGSQELAVEFAVIAYLFVFFHLSVHFWEKFLQKWLHRCHSTFKLQTFVIVHHSQETPKLLFYFTLFSR